MKRPALAAVLLALALALAPCAPGQVFRPPGWRPPPALDFALTARTLQSAVDWRQREEAAGRLGGSGDLRWLDVLATAAANDPSLRVRRAARDAIVSIREANGRPGPGTDFPRPPPDPWGGGALPGDHYADMVESWYQRYLHRSVDPGGLASRLTLLRRGADPEDVEVDIIGSDEYWERNGSNVVGFVRGLYADVLGRVPNRDEVRGWVQRYAVNRANRSAVAREFLRAAARERLDNRLP
jgi:hypothetical protein